jgi:hypothetical protein
MPDFVQNDTACALRVTCYDQDNKPIDLSGCTVELHFYINSNPPVFVRQMNVTDAVNGKVEYKFSTYTDEGGETQYDLGQPGVLRYKLAIKFADGSRLTSPFEGEITIHEVI